MQFQAIGAMESIVLNLAQLGAPKVGVQTGPSLPAQILIGSCLLLLWSKNLPSTCPRFHFLDLFAGVANATKVWPLVPRVGPPFIRSTAGYTCASVDESYFPGERTMNFVTPAGFSWLGYSVGPLQLRLIMWVILCEYPEAVNLMGPCCSSWGLPARGTSCRNYVNPHGLCTCAS